MLDPVRAVPAYETWLFDNKKALASVKRGLADSAAGRTKKRGVFAPYAKGPDEGTGKKRIPILTIVAITPHP